MIDILSMMAGLLCADAECCLITVSVFLLQPYAKLVQPLLYKLCVRLSVQSGSEHRVILAGS